MDEAIVLKYEISPDDFTRAGEASSDVKGKLKQLGVSPEAIRKVAIAGGVASNSALRASMAAACGRAGLKLYYPSPIFCTDNAAMIGAAAYYEYKKGVRSGLDLNAVPNLRLGER